LANISADFFRDVVEPLADRFEPALCDEYVRVFAPQIEAACPDLRGLAERYQRIRHARPIAERPSRVFVLSRVTIGADVAITSVILDAAKKRWPEAAIVLVGPAKNYELFAADPGIAHRPVHYPRAGTLEERLAVRSSLTFDDPDSIVIDPDSRLTQLGLIPVCPDHRYYFFESRSYGGDSADSLVALTRRWAAEIIGIADARPFIATPPVPAKPDVTVSLGVGENPAKRLADPFESDLLRLLVSRHSNVLVDSGGGGEEAERVRAAVAASGNRARIFTGSFAEFAAHIANSRLYVGYDSAGGHVAAACGTPLVSIFAGFPTERMLQRWRPDGPGSIRLVRGDVAHALVRAASPLLATPGSATTSDFR